MKAINNIILACSLMILTACNATPFKKQKHIGIVLYDSADTFIASINEEMIRLGNVENYLVTTYDGARSQLTQNEEVRQLIHEGVDALCVNLVDRTATSTIIHAAQKANIPVIFFNREPVESDLNRWERLYYVGADAEESGRLQGQLTAGYIMSHPEVDKNKDGIIQYYILEGEPGHQDAIVRSETSAKTLQDAGVFVEKVGYAICDWKKEEAYSIMQKQIVENLRAELIISNNDDMASGAIEAYEDAKIAMEDRPIIVGIDGTKDGLKLVEDGKMIGTVYNDYQGQAQAMFDILTKIMNHDTNISKYTLLSYQKITQENVTDYQK